MQSNPFSDSVRVVGLYARAQLLMFLWELVLYGVGFWLTRVPLWGLMAFLCALLGWIPRIGGLIGIGLVMLAGFLGGADLLHLGLAFGAWVIVQGLEGFWLTPWLMGKPLGLGPFTVFAALIVGSLAFGPLGLFLAVPVLAVAMVWVRYFKRREIPAAPSPPASRTYVPPTGGNDPDRDR